MFMNSLLIVILLSFIRNCRGQCDPSVPFFMNDQSCTNFDRICIKNDDPQCKLLLNACRQCPPNNLTVVAMLDLAARIRGNQNITNELLEKHINNLKANICSLLWAIIFLLVFFIIIIVLEVRFKCITKCCERMTNRGSKRHYRSLKTQRYEANPPAPESVQEYNKATIDNLKSILPKLTNSTQFLLYKESEKFMQLIAVEKGSMAINSIFYKGVPVQCDYTNTDLVSLVKVKIGKKLDSDTKDLILFSNKSLVEGKEFLFQLDVGQGIDLKYCHIMKLEKVEIAKKHLKSGDFSDIFEGRHPWTKEEIVLKRYQFDPKSNLVETKAFLNELITFQTTRDQPGFVQLLGVCKNNEYFYIAMEKMEKGSVKEYLESKAPLPKSKISKWAKQILEALKYLHHHNTIHRNVKPSNILIDKDGNVKLSSFGVAKYVHGADPSYLMEGFDQSRKGTYRYMAPEVCQNKSYGVQADVWSFGATFVEIATGKPPYHDKNEASALLEIGKSGKIKFELDDSSKTLKDFINACLIADPSNRATVEDLLQHEFVR